MVLQLTFYFRCTRWNHRAVKGYIGQGVIIWLKIHTSGKRNDNAQLILKLVTISRDCALHGQCLLLRQSATSLLLLLVYVLE